MEVGEGGGRDEVVCAGVGEWEGGGVVDSKLLKYCVRQNRSAQWTLAYNDHTA